MDVTDSFRATLSLCAIVVKNQQAVEHVSNEVSFINFVIETIPHVNEVGNLDYIASCCTILRYLLRNE